MLNYIPIIKGNFEVYLKLPMYDIAHKVVRYIMKKRRVKNRRVKHRRVENRREKNRRGERIEENRMAESRIEGKRKE